MNDAIERRHLLRNAGMVAGGAATASGLGAVGAPASAEGGHGGRGLLGSWMVTRTEGDLTAQLVGSFAAGGVIIVHDISPAGPPATGSWKMRDRDSWRATLWTGFPGDTGPGSAGPTLRLRIWGHLEGRRIHGHYAVRLFDPSGAPMGDPSRGTFEGHPLQA
jgi:hypothetical protein